MADLTCPKCGLDAVLYRVEMECGNGHRYGEEVQRPMTPAKGAPLAEGMRMPFGKYKGQLMSDIPIDYFEWALANLDRISPDLQKEMENQIALKSGQGVVRQPGPKISGHKVKF